MYYCTTNSSEKMTEYALEVADAAPIVSSPTGCIVYQDLDQEAKLTCKAVASPAPKIRWFKEILFNSERAPPSVTTNESRVQLRSGDEYGFSIDGFGSGFIQASLKIRKVGSKHYGNYFCTAENLYGEDSLKMSLEPREVLSKSSMLLPLFNPVSLILNAYLIIMLISF
jgi:hypothetical protein